MKIYCVGVIEGGCCWIALRLLFCFFISPPKSTALSDWFLFRAVAKKCSYLLRATQDNRLLRQGRPTCSLLITSFHQTKLFTFYLRLH